MQYSMLMLQLPLRLLLSIPQGMGKNAVSLAIGGGP